MHAVLIVHTNRGDFVLDNQTGRIRSWSETGYTWLKRQSRQNPKKWVRLSGRPVITGSIAGKPNKQPRKSRQADKTSALALLTKIRNKKPTTVPKKRVSRTTKSINLSPLPPLPTRNVSRHSQKRMAKLLARLKDVQKRLAALKQDEERIAQQLTKLKTAQKALLVKTAVKTEKAAKTEKVEKVEKSVAGPQKTLRKEADSKKSASKRRSTKKTVTKRKSAGKSVKKRRTIKRASRKQSSTKALTLLKKLRKSRRHKPQRPYKRRWVQKHYSEYFFSI